MNKRAWFAMVPVTCLLACGGSTASVEDVQSELAKSVSLASEAEMFVEYLGQGRSTAYFAEGHLHYLRDEVNRTTQEISDLHSDPGLMKVLNIDRAQLRLLEGEIDAASQNVGQSRALYLSAKRIREIRILLQQTSSSL
jgi:hypothetical protein